MYDRACALNVVCVSPGAGGGAFAARSYRHSGAVMTPLMMHLNKWLVFDFSTLGCCFAVYADNIILHT